MHDEIEPDYEDTDAEGCIVTPLDSALDLALGVRSSDQYDACGPFKVRSPAAHAKQWVGRLEPIGRRPVFQDGPAGTILNTGLTIQLLLSVDSRRKARI